MPTCSASGVLAWVLQLHLSIRGAGLSRQAQVHRPGPSLLDRTTLSLQCVRLSGPRTWLSHAILLRCRPRILARSIRLATPQTEHGPTSLCRKSEGQTNCTTSTTPATFYAVFQLDCGFELLVRDHQRAAKPVMMPVNRRVEE